VIPLLGKEGRAALARFVEHGTLLAFDYDGTLAPIVADPRQAQMRARTHLLLGQVTRRYPTVIITGRSRLDLMRLLTGITSLEVIGNHGLETDGLSGARYVRRVEAWHSRLSQVLGPIPGLLIENKRYSLAIHYRHCADPEVVRQAIARAVEALRDVRVVGGKKVTNLIPVEAPDKGRALLGACARLGCRRAVYVGDDDTDEDVFALDRPEILLTVRVGSETDSSADYRLDRQDDVDEFLEILIHRSQQVHDPS